MNIQLTVQDGREVMIPDPKSRTLPYWIGTATGSQTLTPAEMHELLYRYVARKVTGKAN